MRNADSELYGSELQSRMSQPARTKATDAFRVADNGILFATDGMTFPPTPLLTS